MCMTLTVIMLFSLVYTKAKNAAQFLVCQELFETYIPLLSSSLVKSDL